ncbi:MAG: MBL fold metallo-hydrolase [Gammaproteobacteria bacterium]
MRFATLASGSNGNATLIVHGGHAVLIDCGLSLRQVEARAGALGFALGQLDAVLVTHEHDDHLAGAGALSRKYGIPLWLSAGTRLAGAVRLGAADDCRDILPGVRFEIGPFECLPVIVPHDAREPCQFVVAAGGTRLGILTDVGQSTPHLLASYADLDALVLEFNHDTDLLRRGPYPPALQARVGGDYGHLSNAQAETILGSLDQGSLRYFTAAHLSEKNNTPHHVEACIERALAPGVRRHVASQGEPSPWFDLDD